MAYLEKVLFKRKELADVLSMGIRQAVFFCEKNGVYPINVGTGKKICLRWIKEDVMALIDTIRTKSIETAQTKPRKKIDFSPKALFAKYGS